ncbi:MAG: lysophospholipid acyltransferase family protein [Rhodospirillales bacterium]|nr:lysophospholipid acyltransferase family protein [Rhodospirillales bacterium]
MRKTVFTTPGVSPALRALFWVFVRARGWQRVDPVPDVSRAVLVVAPHTSNWDFPIGVTFGLAYRLKAYWLGKDSLFKPPYGGIFRWFGGMPVDRSKSNKLVDSAIALFDQEEELLLAITPEGTRSRVKEWKSGFYHIAVGAKVPIALAFIDYGTKTCGIGKVITPSGDYAADLAEIKAFYAKTAGCRPDQWSLGGEG